VSKGTQALLAGFLENLGKEVRLERHTEAELIQLIEEGAISRLRMIGGHASDRVLLASARAYVYVARSPVLACGRIELLWYLKEQSISDNYHRYGNLGEHGAEGRQEVI
jgi:RHH-type proline utilization regulon transcriptional repressor/proline dehydrogenase/delta 1-pyrroline-5-carboxylate dehydrogenase